MEVFTKQEIKNYLINRSFLVNKAQNLDEYFERFKCIQVDPVVVIARSHDLSLFNRVKGFTAQAIDTDLYKNRTLFEYFMQLYSIIPIKYRPYFSFRMNIKNSWQEEFYKDHSKEVEMAREFIKENGPTSSKMLKHIPKTRAIREWRSWDSGKATLDYLWDTGEITISHRDSNTKFYNLTERILPKEYLNKKNLKESLDFLIKSNFDYLGIVRASSITKSCRSFIKLARERFAELLEKEEIIPIKVEGIHTKYFVLTSEVENIKKLGKENHHKGLNILPPLDPLIIDRQILSDFFDYEYLWEFYNRPETRKFDPYGMPVLYKGEIIGQVALKKDIKKKTLKIKKTKVSLNDQELKTKLKEVVKEIEKFVFNK